jgi:hypothetical protein
VNREFRHATSLDHLGVLNRAIVGNGPSHLPAAVAELGILPDAPNALEVLKAVGLLLISATNQPGVACGAQWRGAATAIHAAVATP